MESALGALRLYVAGESSEEEVFRRAKCISGWVASKAAHQHRPVLERTEEDITSTISDEEVPIAQVDLSATPRKTCASESDDAGEHVTELFSWGQSTNYQLGFPCTHTHQAQPRHIPLRICDVRSPSQEAKVQEVSCGRCHSIAITMCGSVFTWGFGAACSNMDTHEGASVIVEPMQIPEFGPGRHCAVKVAAGGSHSLALTASGKIFSWGSNAHGQLGFQGASLGNNGHVKRPTLVKSVLKNEEVRDIASGAEHSLCIVSTGGVFAWGSNAQGSLGLGLPPVGPAELAQPQELPHLRGIALAASASSHVSIVIAAHGDAVIFGAPLPPDGRGNTGRNRPAQASTSADPKGSVPTRVTRRERKISGKDEEWQKQRGAATTLPPLKSVALGADDAFGIDTAGRIWTWPLQGLRPCVAEPLRYVVASSPSSMPFRGQPTSPSNQPALMPRPVEMVWSTIGCNINTIWATEDSLASSLWQVRHTTAADRKAGMCGSEEWIAERLEQLDQVSRIACGPEHQAAIVRYRRPPPIATGTASVEYEAPDEEADESTSAAQTLKQPLSLQEICEGKLVRVLSPRTFAFMCELAWELRRPDLLDCAYRFLRANAAMMFTPGNLPSLAQLPIEVLAAFELTEAGLLSSPSAALDMDPGEFPPEEWRSTQTGDADSTSNGMLAGPNNGDIAGTTVASVRKRRRGVRGINAATGTTKAGTPKSAQFTQSPPLAAVSPLLHGSSKVNGATSPKVIGAISPKVGSAPASTDGWTDVCGRRKTSDGGTIGNSKSSPPVATPSSIVGKASPQAVPFSTQAVSGHLSPVYGHLDTPKSASSAPHSPPLEKKPTPSFSLGDFLRPKPPTIAYGASGAKGIEANADGYSAKSSGSASRSKCMAEGPSQTLTAALESAKEIALAKESPWMKSQDAAENPVSMRDILAESKATKKRGHLADEEKTRNSWGCDVLPEVLRQNSLSIAEAQEKEEDEKAQQEIHEFEAMFAALEVAEHYDQLESLGVSITDESKASKEGPQSRGRGRGRGNKEDTYNKSLNGRKKGKGKGGDAWWSNGAWTKQSWWNSASWWDGNEDKTSNVASNDYARGRRCRGRKGRGKGDERDHESSGTMLAE